MTDPETAAEFLASADQAIGKAVARVACYDPYLLIEFTDGTRLILRATHSYEDSCIEVSDMPDDHDARELGIIDQAEYDRRRAAERERRQLEHDARERSELDRLKRKFGQ